MAVSRRQRRLARHMELVQSNSFPGKRGKTLIEKMQDALDAELLARGNLTDAKERLKNEGKILGMVKMLSIMRTPSSPKHELELAKARILLTDEEE